MNARQSGTKYLPVQLCPHDKKPGVQLHVYVREPPVLRCKPRQAAAARTTSSLMHSCMFKWAAHCFVYSKMRNRSILTVHLLKTVLTEVQGPRTHNHWEPGILRGCYQSHPFQDSCRLVTSSTRLLITVGVLCLLNSGFNTVSYRQAPRTV